MLYNFPNADKKPFEAPILKTFVETCAKRNPDFLFEVVSFPGHSTVKNVKVTCSGVEVGFISVYVSAKNGAQIRLENKIIHDTKRRSGGYKTKDLKKAYKLFKEFFDKPAGEVIFSEELATLRRGKNTVTNELSRKYSDLRDAIASYIEEYAAGTHDFVMPHIALGKLREAWRELVFFNCAGIGVVLDGDKVHYTNTYADTPITCSIEEFPADQLAKVLSLKILEDGKHVMGAGYKHSYRSFWING